MTTDAAMPSTLRLLKALADESRLRVVGILANGERSVDELAAQLDLRAPTVSHHLARLRDVGLVSMRSAGNVHIYRLELDALRNLSRDAFSVERIATFADNVNARAWERKVLRDFFDGPRLKEIPASRKKRTVVLEWLANQFSFDTRYREVDVNEVLKQHHPDSATLRRELVGAGLLEREQSVYWRPSASADLAKPRP